MIIFFFNRYCSNINEKDLYSQNFVSALAKGQIHLEEQPSEGLLNLSNPYDYMLRKSSGLLKNVDFIWDAALYNGKYYVYFGIFPAISIMLPYHLITGDFLTSSTATLIFSILSIITLSILVKEIFKKYFTKLDFRYMAFSVLIMMFGTLLIWINVASRFYELVVSAGLFFATLGILLILTAKKEEKISYIKILIGALSLAIAVACRPTQIFATIIIIPFIWDILKNNIKQKKNIAKLVSFIIIPYLVIGILLMQYNYIRFGSIFEFGTSYQLTINDMRNQTTKASIIPTTFICDLFNLPVFKATFPFIEKNRNIIETYSYYFIDDIPGGVFTLSPIAFLCFGIYRFLKNCKNKELKNFTLTLLLTGILLIIVSSQAGSVGRYFVDFAWMFVLSGVIIFMNNIENVKAEESKNILTRVLYAIVVYTILINIFSGFIDYASTYSMKNISPSAYFNTEYSIMFLK